MKMHESFNDKNTFIVKVEYCQNGTWQGRVTWAEENRSERFRSALELVKLMDEAVGSSAIANNKTDEVKRSVNE